MDAWDETKAGLHLCPDFPALLKAPRQSELLHLLLGRPSGLRGQSVHEITDLDAPGAKSG